VPQGEGVDFGVFSPLAQWFLWRILQQKCIRLVRESTFHWLSEDVLNFVVDDGV